MSERNGQAEAKQPTRKAPAAWFTGDVYIDAIHVRKPAPSRMACGCVDQAAEGYKAMDERRASKALLLP